MILYTTDCPKCKILEKMMDRAEMEFTKETNIDKLINLGFKSAPILEVEPQVYLPFESAISYVAKGGF